MTDPETKHTDGLRADLEQRLQAALISARWNPADHPRKDDGEFARTPAGPSSAPVSLDSIRTPLSHSGLACGEAALESFGITERGKNRTSWGRVTARLRQAGYSLTRVVAPWGKPPPVGKFISDHPRGDWLINTSDHIMALRDGKLTDTDTSGGALRRVIEAYKVQT